MGIFDKREAYKPFEYPEVTRFTDAMSKSYWVHSEVEFTADVQDYKVNLTDVEREALKRSLLGIAQIEVSVKTFWGDLYKMFPKPEFNNLGMSFGESECFDKETQILTNNGFKYFKDLTEDDKVAQYSLEDKSISFVKPLNYITKPFKGKMHHYEDEMFDLMVTPNHEIIVREEDSIRLKKVKSCEVPLDSTCLSPVSGYAKRDDEFTSLDKLLVALQVEGRVFIDNDTEHPKFNITLKKGVKVDRLYKILLDIRVPFTMYDKDDCVSVDFSLKGVYGSFDLNRVKNFSYINIEKVDRYWGSLFLEELRFWTSVGNSSWDYFNYHSACEECVDKVASE